MQKTKMIFTIGPASNNEEILREFIKIGMSVARLNCSHGTQDDHRKNINILKKLRDELSTPTGILLDIKGPKIRTHNFINDVAKLKKGDKFSFLCSGEILGDNTKCSISYEELYKDIKVGGTILVDDGLLEFKVLEVRDKEIITEVIIGGEIKSHKGVNVPNVKIKLPALTDKDKADIVFGCKEEVDFFAISFVRKAEDIVEARKLLSENNGEKIKLIAKIESQEGVDNIDEIIEVTDGVMVARGDMGVEIPIERVPILQKQIIKKCNASGKVVITATQMLDSMIKNSRPTRAEACDICNAIFDGTDAIMLSGESAAGAYPLEAARTMSRIALEAEANFDYVGFTSNLREPSLSAFEDAISYTASRTANILPTKAIVAATKSGATAKLISKYKPRCPIVAITPFENVRRSLSLNFGIIPELCEMFNTTDDIINEARESALRLKLAEIGDNILVAAGMPTTHVGGTNMLKIEKI
ncbi:pyruvate kinase [Clostridium sp. 'White wine YQ']|uniref:pyruvate kinase n=1 Tax=Clostridium sp. 'White wine YQ' TaxID=3027474 RepID=UPI0023666DE0|nr:pyruvate kinase [Clostridium sp. 'White wine YQ']MDD7794894.1 pyruvate kinase [Clostridium sp. 'White wine YQ']